MKTLSRSAILAGFALLGGCLVSETALFTAENATATPLAPGAYDACSGSDDGEEADCNPMSVTLSEDGAYVFLVEDDSIDARMVAIDEDDYAIQLSEGGEDFQYYWGRIAGGAFTLVMMWCEDLPVALVDKLVEDGAIEADEDRRTCTAKTPAAVIVAARAYMAGENTGDVSWVTMTPTAAAP
jgi:hypothetical protein